MCPCMTPNISINNGGVTGVEGGVPPNRNDYQTEEEYMHEVDAYLNRQRFFITFHENQFKNVFFMKIQQSQQTY